MHETPPLRGREGEFALICDLLAAAGRGEGSFLVVEGRAGFGKTRLLQAAARQAAAAGLRAGVGSAEDGGQAVPMMTLMSALFEGSEPLLDRAKLRDLPSAPEQQFWLRQELAGLLEAAALDRPLLMCLDDMQWADSSTLSALRSLTVQLADLAVVWILALRPEGASGEALNAVARLRRQGSHQLSLGPLGAAATRQVLADMLGSEPDHELSDLAASMNGNPFLLVELLRGLMDEGRLRLDSGRVHVAGAQLPARLRDSMRVRLGYRSPEARQVAAVAAVLGRRFTHDQLAAVLGSSVTALLSPVGELLAAGLIAEDGNRLAFEHDLIREAVLETLPVSSRRAVQRRAVDVFLAEGAPPVEVARQLADSAEPGDHAAVSLLSRAAESLRMLDSAAAADLAVKALDLAAPDDGMRGSLVAQAALLLFAAGRSGEGQALAQGALRELFPARQQAGICLAISEMFSIPADIREQACRWALQCEGVPEPMRLRLRARLAWSVLYVGKVTEAQELLDEIEPEIAATDEVTARFVSEATGLSIALMEDRFADALGGVQALRSSSAVSAPMCAFIVDQTMAELLALQDDFDEALRMAGIRVGAAQRDDQVWIARSIELTRGRHWAAAGRLEDAAAALEGVSPTLEPYQMGNAGDAAVLAALGLTALHTGNQRQSRKCERAACLAMSVLPPEPRQHAAWLIALRRMAGGDAAGARAVLTDGRDPSMPVLPRFFADPANPPQLVRIALACGDGQLAAEAAGIGERRSARNPGIASLAAIAAHARGLRDRDAGELARAVGLFAGSPRRLAAASAVEDLGRLLGAQGRPAEAITRLTEALRLYAGMGATWDATRVRGRLRRLGVRRNLQPARPAHGWAGLTDSELAVVRLVAAGQANRQVAAQLYLSPHTVSSHLRRIFAKLGIRSRVELVRLFVSRQESAAAAVPIGPDPGEQ